jgi:hypothetical protein
MKGVAGKRRRRLSAFVWLVVWLVVVATKMLLDNVESRNVLSVETPVEVTKRNDGFERRKIIVPVPFFVRVELFSRHEGRQTAIGRIVRIRIGVHVEMDD